MAHLVDENLTVYERRGEQRVTGVFFEAVRELLLEADAKLGLHVDVDGRLTAASVLLAYTGLRPGRMPAGVPLNELLEVGNACVLDGY